MMVKLPHHIKNLSLSTPAAASGADRLYSFPASFAQRRLWFLNQFEPDQSSYVVPMAWRMTGRLDIHAATLALNRIVARHDTLRTTFNGERGEPVQIVHPYQPFEIVVEDLGAHSDSTAAAREAANAEANIPFDLATGPLFRYRILRLADDDHLLLFTTHHIVFDGWSKSVWIREFSAFYREEISGQPADVAELQIQYGDFAAWQKEHLSGPLIEKLLSFWKNALDGAPALLELPTDRTRPAVQSFDGALVPFKFSNELTAALRKLCRETNSTLFMVLLAALQVLLSRLSGQREIVVGTPIANRERLELEPLIGFFSNTLLMRETLNPDDTFLDVLARVKHFTLEAYAHQDMPFERLVEHLRPERSLSYNPLFQVMFALHNIPREAPQLEGLSISGLPSGRLKTKFDLFVSVVDDPEALRGAIEFGTALFDSSTIERLVQHYRELLSSVVTSPSSAITLLPILGEGERRQIVSSFNQTGRDFQPPLLLHEFLESSAANKPDGIALIDGERRITFAELNACANRIAHSLFVRPDDLVGIYMERTPQMVASIFGALKAGAAYLPLDPTYPQHRIADILDEAKPKVVIASSALASSLPATSATIFCVDRVDAEFVGRASTNPVCPASPHHLAFVLFTSGSTGRPKGVALEHRNSVNFVQWCLSTFTPQELSGVLFGTSTSFDMSTFEMFVTVAAGGKMVLVENPLLLSSAPAANEVTFMNTVPSVMAELLRSGSIPQSVGTVLLAGEALSDSLATEIFDSTGISALHNSYGPTEGGYATWELVRRGKRVTIGRPISNHQAYILDSQGNPQPIGVPGELFLAGAGLARGYLNRPDLTAERFLPNPFVQGFRMYKTGDLCRWLADGSIEYLGRLDRQVKLRGFRIELSEIEIALGNHPDVLDCAVVVREDVRGDRQLIAYSVPRSGTNLQPASLRSALKSTLPEYMLPAVFVMLDALPLTPNGKVDRKALPDPVHEAPTAGNEEVSTPTEEIVAGIWAQVLRLDKIAIDDDFFALGGHSLLATQLIAQVAHAFHVDLPLRRIFENPTVRTLSEQVDQLRMAGTSSALPPLTRVNRNAPIPLSFAQQRFWLMNQLIPDDPGYNVNSVLHILGPLDPLILKSAVTEIIARNEVLRTIYKVDDGVPYQLIQPPKPAALTIVNLEQATEQQVLQHIAVAAQRPFNLSIGPVCRFLLYRIEAQDHIFAMISHHICMDGTSSAILFQDLSTLYSRIAAHEQTRLPEESFDYADYANWQRSWMQGPVLEEHLSFWRNHLQGAPPFLRLPVDHHIEQETSSGALRSQIIDAEFLDHLVKFCRVHKVTQFMVMIWTVAIVLHRWSRDKILVIGTVAGNRPLSQLERIVGCFLNLIPLRLDVDSSDLALDVLTRAKSTVLDGFSHGQCPFDAIVDAMRAQRSPHRNPIFNVGLLFQNYSEVAFKADPLEARFIGLRRETAMFDLRFVVSALDERMRIACEYKRDLFEAETIDLLLDAYTSTLRSLVLHPAVKVGEVAIPSALVAKAEASRGDEGTRVLISATFTAEPIEEPLTFWLRELEIKAKIEFTPNHQVFQQLLDPDSALRRNKSGFNILLVRFEDFHQFDDTSSDSKRDNIRGGVEDLISAVSSAVAQSSATWILCCCPPSRALADETEWASFLAQLESSLVERLGSYDTVNVITSARLNNLYPVAEYDDKAALALGHIPYTTEFTTALATIAIRYIWGLSTPPYKVIALDCDNTLWNGICGEDGPLGVTVDAARMALQQEMLLQLKHGMLLCLCSKNSEQDVWDVFDRNPGMLLRREHITAHRINWEEKPNNLRSLAQELGLGIDSFVFLDDSPIECAAVESQCPEVLTLQLPAQTEEIPTFLRHVWAFDHLRSTEVDQRRSELYRDERRREQLRSDLTLDEFIQSLELNIAIEPLSDENVTRVAQLTQRSNQFNLTTIRRQDLQVRELLSSETYRCWTVNLSDRFGDYGLIGVVIFTVAESALVVETFLLSCRALGRRVEHTVLDRLREEARRLGLASVDLQFSATAKNAPAYNFLDSIPGAFRSQGQGLSTYRLSVSLILEESVSVEVHGI